MPIALISLIDEEHQRWPGAAGLPDDLDTCRMAALDQEQKCLSRVASYLSTWSTNMYSKLLTAALLASVTLVPALAQSDRPATTKPPAAAQTAPKAHSAMWRSSKLIGLDVYNEQNENLGEINEILLDKSGKVAGVVIGVGGFLGMGERDIMVEMSKLKFVDEPVRTSAGDRTTTTGAGDRPDRKTTDARTGDRKWYPDHAVLTGAGNKDQLKNMREFKYD